VNTQHTTPTPRAPLSRAARHCWHEPAPAGAQRPHSASIHHTAGRSILRWDLATPDEVRRAVDRARAGAGTSLDGAAADVASSPNRRGQVVDVLIVLDADEEPAFRARFGSLGEFGQLDWPPRATTLPPLPTRVYAIDDAHEYRRGRPVATETIGARTGASR
jgi:hypothetical protein